MKDIKNYLINEQNEADLNDATRAEINKFRSKPIEGFIGTILWAIEDELKSFKPKKQYDYATPEMIEKYKDEWQKFAEYLGKYK